MPPVAVAALLFLVLGLVGVRTTLKGLKQLEREDGLRRICGGKAAAASGDVDKEEVLEGDTEPPLPFPLPDKRESALSFLVADNGEYGPPILEGGGDSHKSGSYYTADSRRIWRRSVPLDQSRSWRRRSDPSDRHRSWRRSWHRERSSTSAASRASLRVSGLGPGSVSEVTAASVPEAGAVPAIKSDVVSELTHDGGDGGAGGGWGEVDKEAEARAVCAALLERETRTALWKPALLTLCFGGVLALEAVAGKGFAGARCSWGWWLTTVAVIPWALGFVAGMRKFLLWDAEVKVRKR